MSIVRTFLNIIPALCAVAFMGLPAYAVDTNDPAVTKKSMPPKILALFSKDPATWKVVASGARGTLSYHEETGQFTLDAIKLQPLREYALIRLSDVPPYGRLLVEGSSDQTGQLHLQGVWKEWSKKFWLVLSSDIIKSGTGLYPKAWHPEQYLFEEKILTGLSQ